MSKMGNAAVTYMPESGIYLADKHEQMPGQRTTFGRSPYHRRVRKSKNQNNSFASSHEIVGSRNQTPTNTEFTPGNLRQRTLNQTDQTWTPLSSSDYTTQLMGEQVRWFHLDNMFNPMNVDQLLLRVPFKDNPAAAQTVPRRGEYDTSKVNYDEINLDLPKTVVSHDMPIEDPLRALINPLIPLQSTDDYSMAYHREKEALAALQNLKYYYKKDEEGEAKFTTTDSALVLNNDANRISNPNALTAGNFHSDKKMVNQVQEMRNEFMEQYDIILTHFAMSPITAMNIAQNTWTEPNTINNVEAYRTNGGVQSIPRTR